MEKKHWVLALLIGALSVAPALAGPLVPGSPPADCAPGSLQGYIDLNGAGGCSIGSFVVRDFYYSASGGGGYVPYDASYMSVIPVNSALGPQLWFGSVDPSQYPVFSVPNGQSATLLLRYYIDPPPIIIRGFEDEMEAWTPVAPGWARITTSLCIGAPFDGSWTCPNPGGYQVVVYHNGGLDYDLSQTIWFPPTSNLGVLHRIELDGGAVGTPGSADFADFGATALTIPEPASWLLLGCGLLGLALLRRRRAA